MKKTTLISTLAMVVIVALALTTATFAWYTANTQVIANASGTAAVTSSANFYIGKTADPTTSTPISVGTTDLKLDPAAPTTDWSTADTAPKDITTTDAAKALLKTATIDNDSKYRTAGADASVDAYDIYVKNADGAAAATPKVTLSTQAKTENKNASNFLRVAVYVVTGTTGNYTYTYKGTLATATGDDAKTVCGSITKGSDVLSTFFATTPTATITFTDNSLNAGDSLHIVCIAWFDGAKLGTAQQGYDCTYALTFDAAN